MFFIKVRSKYWDVCEYWLNTALIFYSLENGEINETENNSIEKETQNSQEAEEDS